MAKQRRVFNNYPESLRTRQNNRETFIADDPLFEPEQANFLNGFIGDVSVLTDEDLARKPVVLEMTPERQKYQLSVGANFIDPDSQERVSAAFYTDMINQIEANGGFVDDPNRVFATNFYAWTPPIDYDKHINFSRYRWVGVGSADVQGEFITIEPSHSKTVIYEWDGSNMQQRNVSIVNGLPPIEPDGTFVEDASVAERFIYRSNGVIWVLLNLDMVPVIPTQTATLDIPSYFYVTRTGPEFNRPLVWKYSGDAGRWIPQPVIVSSEEPETIRDGMVWEDVRVGSERVLKVAANGAFSDLIYTASDGPPGAPGTDGEYIYDTRNFSDLDPNSWEANNWWRHHEDLSPEDAARAGEDQATRPIIEFWNGLEQVVGDVRDGRNDSPVFKKFAYDVGIDTIIDTGEGTTIFEYQRGSGRDDFVLGFPLVFNDTGEFIFELTLETDTSSFIGYKYFLDTNTNVTHGIWFKSDVLTNQEQDVNGIYEIPVGISSNPDHDILTAPSRSRMLGHMTSIMKAQSTFSGSEFGLNSYRWTNRNPTIGSTIIDAEQTHLRTLATLQRTSLDVPNSIRTMAKEYNKVLFRFTNRLNQYWNELRFNTGSGTLTVTAAEAVDGILTSMFIGRNEDFPFYLSDMGTYLETTIEAGVPTVINPDPRPIFIAPSAARVGASPCFVPDTFEDRDGVTRLRGHEGMIVPSFGDERDLVWLELQNRFFASVPTRKCSETSSFSSRFSRSNFFLQDFYGNFVPNTSTDPVDDVVTDYNAIVGPADGLRVFSAIQAVIAVFSGGQWLLREALTDEVFLNLNDNEYYIFNGQSVNLIDRWNNPFDFDYTTNEFREIVRRDFERFILFREQDFSENITFDEPDRFTWNYRSAGVEGHYLGIYRRIYNTVRPHSHPWEVMGYFIEPDWWRTQYVPDSTAADGTPRYGSAHSMWADFAAGVVDHPSGPIQRDKFVITAPVPVDASGNLLDPIAAGVVDESKVDKERIDDIWVYGDGAPEEQKFLDSPFNSFSVSLAGYLMKNGIWMDTLWSEIYIGIGEGQVFRAPHVINQTTLTRPAISILPVHLETDSDGNRVQSIGVNAWISEFVNINGGSPNTDFSRVVRNTSPALSWKTSGFINKNRTVISTLSRNEIPFTDVHVLLHKSQPIKSTFCSGVLITRESPNGFRVFGFDQFDPFFTVERPAVPIVGGQVILTEEFTVDFIDNSDPTITGGSVYPNQTLQRTFEVTEFSLPRSGTALDTARLSVIINGLRIKPQFLEVDPDANTVTVDEIIELQEGDEVSVQVVTTQSNPSTQTRQFIVNDVAFPYFVTGTGEFERIEYGRFFETATEVINFMIGYGRFLVSEGWVFDDISEAGSTRDWLLGAQRFARWVLEVQTPWNPNPQLDVLDEDLFFYSPIQNNAKFVSEFGQGQNIESIMNGAFGIVNRRSEPIETDQTFVSRIDDEVTVARVDTSNTDSEIYGLRVNLNEVEHVVLFSNITRFNDIVYDPVSGLAQSTLIVDSYRTLNWEGRAEANGYIIDGGTLLPNFEKQAFDITRLYDRFRTVDNVTKREQARNLYGFVPANQSRFNDPTKSLRERVTSDSSQYMIPIGAADRSRFDFSRGMIQANGTVRPIFAFARGSTIGRDNFFISEDWAWKLQEYGDTRRQTVQIKVDKSDFRDEVQTIQFGGPVVVTNNTIEVPDFNRNDLEADGDRWILPPEACEFGSPCNLKFPIDRNTGLIDVNHYAYYATLYDTESDISIIDHFHYDPEIDRFEPSARSLIDYETPLDPARYNTIPARPETTFIDMTMVNGSTLTINQDGDYFDISSTTARYRFWFSVSNVETTNVITPAGSTFAVDTTPGGGTVAGQVWTLNEAPTDDPHHVWYSVEDSEVSSVTFTGVSGSDFTVPHLIETQTEADYNGVGQNGIFEGGSGYAVADTITLSDGSVLTVDSETAGVIDGFTVTTTGSISIPLSGSQLTQTSTSGSGTGFTLTPRGNNILIVGDFFTVGVPGGFYHVWFDILDSNIDPLPSGSLASARVALNGSEDDLEIATIVADVINNFQDGNVFSTNIPQPGFEVVEITNLEVGASSDIATDVAATTPAGVTFATITQGNGPNADPATTANGHKVAINATDSGIDIATKTAAVLAAVDAFAETLSVNSTVTVVNSESGNVTDAVDIDAGVMISITQNGSGSLNTAPPSGGNTLVEVAVISSDTNVNVATKLVTALQSADTDFADSSNTEGVSPIVRVTLVTAGRVMNANVGLFLTPPIITVRSGNDATPSANPWGAEQIGCLWWRPARKLFIDYRRISPDYESMSAVWGKPLFYKSTITRTNDVAEVELFQFDDHDRNGIPADLNAELGLKDGDEFVISIRGADQPEYNLTNVTATVASATTGLLQFEIATNPVSPGTGDIEVVFGHMDIYEWVESMVPPQEWVDFVSDLDDPTHPNGTPLNVDEPSFVEIEEELADGRTRNLYYFWVLNSTGDNTKNALPVEGDPGKEFTSFEISQRLTNPTARGLAWFAPINESHMYIHTDGEKVLDDYGIQINIDSRCMQTHHEFVLVSENNQFFPIPEQIVEKMIDSLSGQDAKGNTVPSPLLEVTERFGSCFFPIQTVFPGREAAVDVYVTAINRILSRRDLTGTDGLLSIFQLDEEYDETTNPTGFWQRAPFEDPSIDDLTPLETVATIAERDRRLSFGFYVEGDLVRVVDSGFIDAWDGSSVAATFQLRDTEFFQVSIDNKTAALNDNVDNNVTRFRSLFGQIYDLLLERIEQNELIFSLLNEMLIQNPDPTCDWFFKTSYVTTQTFTSIDTSPFVRPDEVAAIRDALLSTKPFRTKIRGDINTIGGINDDTPVEILEFPDQKITLVADRLSCNLLDDCGWDTFAWDTRDLPCDRWDLATWDLQNLGREEFYLVEQIVGSNVQTVFEIDALFDPTLYEVKVEVRQNGVLQPNLANQITIDKRHDKIIIDTQFALGPTFTVDVLQAQGFYGDNDPTFIGTTIEDTLFQPAPSDYKHAVARSLRTLNSPGGPFDPRSQMIGCTDPNDPLGGRPEERIVTDVCDSVNICVINDPSDALAGWDATPWDVIPWDIAPGDVGRRVFIVSVGKQIEVPAGTEMFATSEDITVVDPFAIIGTEPQSFNLAQVEQQKGGIGPFNVLTEGVEYESLGIFMNGIRTKIPSDQEFVTDGATQQFQTTMDTEIAAVYLDGFLQVEGVDYTLDVQRMEITFTVVPTPNRLVKAAFLPYIEAGDVIRYRFNGWPLGPEGRFTVGTLVGGLTGLPYDIFRGQFTFDSLPPANEFFTIQFTEPRLNGLPESILVRMPEIVADILDNHESYDEPNGFNQFRPVGTRIINSTTNEIYIWNGTMWNLDAALAIGTQVFVTRTQEIWQFNGVAFFKVFDVGDTFTKPPVLDYPLFGRGITFGTYAFGQSVNANVEYPDAYQVIQHSGDCPP